MNFLNSFATFINKSSNTADCRHEGQIRESLAAYFLTAASTGKQTEQERKQYQQALKQLADIEIRALLQSVEVNRPLRYGDVTQLLISTLRAAKRLTRKSGVCIVCKFPDMAVCTAAEPRIIQMSFIRLIRSFIAVNPQHIIKVGITVRAQTIIVSINAENLPHDPVAMKLLHETARLHKGCVIVSRSTVAFSLRRELPNALGLFAAPTAEELIDNPVSAINVGLS